MESIPAVSVNSNYGWGNKTSEDWWNFIHCLKGNDHYPAHFQCICFAPITVNLFLFLKCFFPPLRFHMRSSFCLWCSSSSLSPLPYNFLIIFIIWFKSQFLRKTLHFQSKVYLFFQLHPVIFPLYHLSHLPIMCQSMCFLVSFIYHALGYKLSEPKCDFFKTSIRLLFRNAL